MLLAIAQTFLGTEIQFILMGFVSLIIAGSPLFFFGLFDITALFAFFLLSKYSIFPFFIKTVMGERIDVGLLAVGETFTVITAGSFIVVAALFAAKTIHIRKRFLGFSLSSKELLTLGYVSYGFGFVLTMLHVIVKPTTIGGEAVGGFGGFGGFIGLLYLGIICATALLVKSDSRKFINKKIILMLAGVLVLSILDNAKLYFTLSLISYIATLFLFGRKISPRYIVAILLLAIFYLGAVVPVIQVLRTDIFKEATLSQRTELVMEFISNSVFGEHDASSKMALLFNYEYYPNLHTPIIDRVEMIQDLDIVLDGIHTTNTIGWRPVTMAIKHITPRILAPDKIPEVDVDVIAYQIGLTTHLISLRRTMGVFGVSYAMFMWPGWLIITFFLLLLYFLMVRKVVLPSAFGNIFGIYFLAKYGINFSETGVQNLIGTMLRAVPIDVITILILLRIARGLVRKKSNLQFRHSSEIIYTPK